MPPNVPLTPIQAGQILSNPPDTMPIPSQASKKSKASLKDSDYEALVKLCQIHGDRYIGQNKTKFWKFISALTDVHLGVHIEGPRQVIERLWSNLEAQLEAEKVASGKVVPESDLRQALEDWNEKYVQRVCFFNR